MSYIASARRDLGLSQKELGEKLGLNQSTISRFETGELEVDERTLLAVDALRMRAGRGPADRSSLSLGAA